MRIENVRFIQVQGSLTNLQCADDVFIGANVTLDLSAPLRFGLKAIAAPGCTFLTHQDFGEFNGNAAARIFPKKYLAVTIGADVVVGADSTVLAGASIGPFAVIGAKSLVTGSIPANTLFVGVPARFVRKLQLDPDAPTV